MEAMTQIPVASVFLIRFRMELAVASIPMAATIIRAAIKAPSSTHLLGLYKAVILQSGMGLLAMEMFRM